MSSKKKETRNGRSRAGSKARGRAGEGGGAKRREGNVNKEITRAVVREMRDSEVRRRPGAVALFKRLLELERAVSAVIAGAFLATESAWAEPMPEGKYFVSMPAVDREEFRGDLLGVRLKIQQKLVRLSEGYGDLPAGGRGRPSHGAQGARMMTLALAGFSKREIAVEEGVESVKSVGVRLRHLRRRPPRE